MSRLKSALLVCCALACAARVQSVNAQGASTKPSEAAKEEASAHFKRGADLFQDGLYRAALVELRRAYDIAPNFRVLYNIGQTHVALGEFVEAIRAYQDYVAEGGSAVPAARRAEVEAELAQLRHNTATLTIRVDRDGAVVLVDEKQVGTAPLAQGVAVNVGRHRISARADDGAVASSDVEVAGGDRKEVALELVAVRVAAVPVADSPAAPAPKPKLSKRQKWAIGVLSSAAALAITGGALALMAKSAHDDYQHELDTQPGNPAAIESARDQLWRTSLTADVMFGTAVLAGVGGAVLLFTKGRQRGEKPAKGLAVRVGLAPHAVVAAGRF